MANIANFEIGWDAASVSRLGFSHAVMLVVARIDLYAPV